MTKNKITKAELEQEFDKVKTNKENSGDFVPYKEFLEEFLPVLDSEITVTLESFEKTSGENFIKRNVICAINSLSSLIKKDYYTAWWEMRDILDYKKDEEYVSENELSLIYIILKTFQKSG